MTTARLIIGAIARLTMWACVFLIVGNAVVWAFAEGLWLLGILELGFFPGTFFLWPLLAPDMAAAWPFPEGTSLIPFLLVALVCYPISTLVGGLDPV